MHASTSGLVEVVVLLVEAGADVMMTCEEGRLALHHVVVAAR